MTEAAIVLPVDEAAAPPRRRGARLSGIALASLIWVVVIALACIFGPLLLHVGANATDVAHAYAPPSALHLLGTDSLGRDELARLLAGGRITLSVGAIAALVAMFIGTVYG